MTTPALVPKHAVLELTFRCNQRCAFCYLPWIEKPEMVAPELSIPDWIAVVDRLATRGVGHFTLTGGEPLVKAGVDALIDHLAAHPAKPGFTLYTNGILVDDALLARFKGTRGSIACSLPGLKQFARLTDSAHTVYEMIDLFARMKSCGVPFVVGVTVTKPALHELEDVVSLAVASGAHSVQVVPFFAEGRGAEHPEFMLTYPEILELGRRIETLRSKIGTTLYFGPEPYCSCRGESRKPAGLPTDFVPPSCQAETRSIIVGPAGQCRKCLHTFEALGDVRELYG